MRRRILHSMLLVTVLALLLCAALFLNRAYGHHMAQLEAAQTQQRALLSAGLARGGRAFVTQLAETEGARLYLFDHEGEALLAEGSAARSPAAAYEFVIARLGDDNTRTRIRERESGQVLLAEVMPLSDGTVLYWETEQAGFLPLGMRTIGALCLLFPLLAALCALSARRIVRALTKPFESARLKDLAVGEVCEELRPLAARMLDQNLQIHKQLQKQHSELKREYEKQDRTRRDFTANVSHELKTPLTAISGYAEILRDGLVREEDVARFSGKIYDEAQRMIVLVGDILKLSQLDEGLVPNARGRLDLYAICERVIARLQSAAEGRGISFTLEGEHCAIVGVEQLIDEVVYNLCDNAIKYNRKGGSVAVSVHRLGDKIALTVEDTGIGISPEEQDRVFERFYRVDKSHSKEVGGTGLGLSIVKHGAAYHEARIEMNSRLGEGTKLRVLFQAPEGEA